MQSKGSKKSIRTTGTTTPLELKLKFAAKGRYNDHSSSSNIILKRNMRFFQKRKAAVDIVSESIPQLYGKSGDHYYGDLDHSVEKTPFPRCAYEENAKAHSTIGKITGNENEYSENKQSIGKLVRKLNCSSSKKIVYDSDQHFVGRDESGYSGEADFVHGSQWKCASTPLRIERSSEITRSVLITVKNGEANEHVPLYNENGKNSILDTEMKNSFIVSQISKPVKMGSSSSFRLGMSARKRHHNATKYFKHLSANNRTRNGGGWHDCNASEQQDIDAKRAAQEAARRERWKRGLEMEKRMFKNASTSVVRDRDGCDSSSTDSLTIGSHTTGTSITGYDTAEDSSSTDDWTDTTDESRLAPNYHRHYGQTSSGGHCADSQEIVESVAEDFGIIAKLLLSDGYACFGTAAAITKETVGSCRGKKT